MLPFSTKTVLVCCSVHCSKNYVTIHQKNLQVSLQPLQQQFRNPTAIVLLDCWSASLAALRTSHRQSLGTRNMPLMLACVLSWQLALNLTTTPVTTELLDGRTASVR